MTYYAEHPSRIVLLNLVDLLVPGLGLVLVAQLGWRAAASGHSLRWMRSWYACWSSL